ncbi:ALP1-like protein isoform X1 [Tanacetum coccineum]
MRKQYTLWKQLKHGETGLGWNASTEALACSNDWWDRKIKENPNVNGFRMKQPSKELQEAWEQLFGGLLAGQSVVVGLGMDQDTSSEIPNVNLENAKIPNVNLENVEIPNVNLENVEIPNVNLKNVAINIDDDTEPIQVWNHYSQHLDAKENDFYSSLMRDVGQDVPIPCSDEISRQPNNKDDPYSVSRCMIVINGMVDDALMMDDNPLFYLAMDLFEDAVNMINMDIQRRNRKRKHGCAHFLMDSMYSCDLVSAYYYKYMHKEPCMTSSQTGEAWMKEVLNGNPIRCVNAFRMHPNVFSKLCGELESSYGLKSSDKMTAVEKLGIFVYTLALGVSNRDVSERFQRSGETISRAFHEILEAITGRSKGFHGLAREMIKPRDPTFQSTPQQIINDKRYMPYFKDCIGCIDGTHIGACIPEAEQIPYIGRKGIPTFNVMAVCDFDLCFTFISVGWEGSAHDTRVFLHAINNRSMNFPKPPEGKYYLVDKGYPDRKGYLVPYPKTRYHKSQFENEPPKNMKEAFNRSHSSL